MKSDIEIEIEIERLSKGEVDKWGLLENRYNEGRLEVLRWYLKDKPDLSSLVKVCRRIPDTIQRNLAPNDFDKGCSDAFTWLLNQKE